MMIMVMTNNYTFPVALAKPKGSKMTLAQEEQVRNSLNLLRNFTFFMAALNFSWHKKRRKQF